MNQKNCLIGLIIILIMLILLIFFIFQTSEEINKNNNLNNSEIFFSDKNCVLWFDGCNYCEVDFSGSLICTKIYCEREKYADPFCSVYSDSNFLENDFEKNVVGYCPTMFEEALKFKQENENVVLIEFQSASDVLLALKNNNIGLAIIGRKAKQYEINDYTQEIMKESSFVIVFKEKILINSEDLVLIPIHTHHVNYPKKYFSNEKVFIHSNFEETISKAFSNNEPALITWEEFLDEFELLVVMNGLQKNKDFRGIFFYN
jgi:hypothetical protein